MSLSTTKPWNEAEELRFRLALSSAHEARERVESHDPQTCQHGVRVAHWAVMMAGRLASFDRRRLRRLEMAALLHDYGKLWIPSSILNRPGPLTEDDWVLVRAHPSLGARNMPVPEEFVEKSVVRWHHKRFDGGGYPASPLEGPRIPLEARITAVADVFDAVTSRRSYRPGGAAMTPDRAFDVLWEMAGTALDPAIVALFEAIYAEESARSAFSPGVKTLALRSVLSLAVQRARRLLGSEIGDFDPRDPLGGRAASPALVERLVDRMVGPNLDAASARNVILHVLRQPLADTFGTGDLDMDPEERERVACRVGNHEERMIHLKHDGQIPKYMSVVVFDGCLWLSIVEEVEGRLAVTLIK